MARPHKGQEIDVMKALKLRVKDNLSYEKVAKIMGCSQSALFEKLKTFSDLMDDPTAITAYRTYEADLTDSIRSKIVQAISLQLSNPKRMQKVSLSQLGILYGIFFDKARMIRGESVQNISQLAALVMAVHSIREQGTRAQGMSTQHSPALTDDESIPTTADKLD